MKSLNFSKNSLHYRLAKEYGDYLPNFKWDESTNDWVEDGTDLCSYTRHVAKGIMVALMITVIVGVLLGCMVDTVVWVVFGTNVPLDGISGFGMVGVALWSVLGAGCGILAHEKLMDYLKAKRQAKEYLQEMADRAAGIEVKVKPKVDGFWTKAFKAFKEKTCYRIELT